MFLLKNHPYQINGRGDVKMNVRNASKITKTLLFSDLLVGVRRLELPTPCPPDMCASQLRHTPINCACKISNSFEILKHYATNCKGSFSCHPVIIWRLHQRVDCKFVRDWDERHGNINLVLYLKRGA